MGWLANAVSSGTATAEFNAPQGKRLVLDGIHAYIVGGGSTASIITLHASESATAGYSSAIIAVCTGGNVNVQSGGSPDGILKAKNIKVAATSNLGSSNTVTMWGHFA